jgi:hypothetical protein
VRVEECPSSIFRCFGRIFRNREVAKRINSTGRLLGANDGLRVIAIFSVHEFGRSKNTRRISRGGIPTEPIRERMQERFRLLGIHSLNRDSPPRALPDEKRIRELP